MSTEETMADLGQKCEVCLGKGVIFYGDKLIFDRTGCPDCDGTGYLPKE